MDIKDVSHLEEYSNMMKQMEASTAAALRRKGETPRDHPPRERLVAQFMMKLTAKALRNSAVSNRHEIHTTHVPAPYLPCVLSLHELRPIRISEMQLETHHRGKKTMVRVLTPPDRFTAVMAIVEDQDGTALLLQVYHLPEESVVPAHETIRLHRVAIIKEPFFKAATWDGAYTLRVDHLSDIVWLDDCDERIPARWRRPPSHKIAKSSSSSALRSEGNTAVGKNKWAEAERVYSSAISAAQTSEDKKLAHLNRSLANLWLGRYEPALNDAIRVNQSPEVSEKGLFREARALYELGDFSRCLERLEALLSRYPNNSTAKTEMARTRLRLQEQRTGSYSFRRMYQQSRANPPIIDCATFSSPVEVRLSPGRGRGLFTTRHVIAGELLLCEKAFAYGFYDDDQPQGGKTMVLMNMATKTCTMGGQASLITQIVQKLYHNPQLSRQFLDLYHGDYKPVNVSTSDGQPVVDTFLVSKIVCLNSFGSPRTSRETLQKHLASKSDKADESKHGTCGIWCLASYINHSCLRNCQCSFIGDMMIVRAIRSLEPGTELFFQYCPTDRELSYKQIQDRLKFWGFKCDCALCATTLCTPLRLMNKRKALLASLRPALMSHPMQVAKAQRVLSQIEETHPPGEATSIRQELWDPYFALGAYLEQNGKPAEAIDMTVKGFRALGFDIVAPYPPMDVDRRDLGNVEPAARDLQVRTWGIVNDYTATGFMILFRAYLRLGPEVCPTARKFVTMAYSMAVGEADTLLEQFPELG